MSSVIIGIIGYGNMGSAIAQKLKANYKVAVFDKDRNKTVSLQGIVLADSIAGLIAQAEAIVLAVKPQDFDPVLKEIKNSGKRKLLISIAAGINTKYIERVIPNARVIRVMPNIGARIGYSVTCFSKGTFADENDLSFARELFYYLGVTKEIKEEMMDAATAISGSGPAYIFDFIEAGSINPFNFPEHTKHDLIKRLERAAEAVGFEREDAAFLAVNTFESSLNLLNKTKSSPAELKKQVVSKGGTTEAALEVLHKGGSWEEAAVAAKKRAGELSKKN